MTLLHPWALLFAIAGLLPLVSLLLTERRAAKVRRLIGEPALGARAVALVAVALISVAVLLAFAIAEPVLEQASTRAERRGVEAYAVLDTSGSMQAAARPGGRTRLERAKALALELRRRLPEVRFGIASMTDRLLPHLFPTGDPSVFAATLAQSVGIERPPPAVASFRATDLNALANLGAGFFTAPRRVAVVFTDGESAGIRPRTRRLLSSRHIRVLYVHVGQTGERIYLGDSADPAYKSDPSSAEKLREAATLTGGQAFGEHDLDSITSLMRHELRGSSATTFRSQTVRRVPIANWFVLGALAPLTLLLARLNLPPQLRRPRSKSQSIIARPFRESRSSRN